MYKSLTADEKALAWKTKYDIFLSQENLSNEQMQFVKKLMTLISPEVFSKSYSQKKERVFNNADEIKNKSIELFGVDGTAALLGTLTVSYVYPPGQGNCDCSKQSDFCPSGHACLRVGCTVVQDDCGWWWSYDCNGDCWIDV